MRLPDEQNILMEAIKMVTTPTSPNPYGQPDFSNKAVVRSRHTRYSKDDEDKEWSKVFDGPEEAILDEAVNKKALAALAKLNPRERMFMFNFFVSGNKKEPESGMNYNMDLGLYNYPHKTAMKGMYRIFSKLSFSELRELEKAAKGLPKGKMTRRQSLDQQVRDELGEVVVDERWWHNEESAEREKARVVSHDGLLYGW
jgi:hypothetical protein